MIKIQILSLVIFALSWGQATAINPEWNLLWVDDFEDLASKPIPAGVRSVPADKEELAAQEQLLFPGNWAVDWGKFPDQYGVAPLANHGVEVTSSSQLVLYGPVLGAGQQLRLEVDCSGTGIVEWGIWGYGLEQGAKQKTKEIDSRAKETIEFELTDNPFDTLRPMLSVSGRVQIEQVRIYGRPLIGDSTVEGAIVAISSIPSPTNSDYPDCYYTAEFKIEHIQEGESTPQRILLLLPAFSNYRPSVYNKLREGDKLRLRIRPFENLSAEQKSVQQADDLQLFELESFLLQSAISIQQFSKTADTVPFSDTSENYISLFDAQLNPPVPAKIKQIQKSFIANDLDRLSGQIAQLESQKNALTQEFADAWDREQKKDPAGYNRVGEKLVWRNLEGTFWALPTRYRLISEAKKIIAGNLLALKELNRALDANGVQLLIQVIPSLYDISARVINPKFRETLDYSTAVVVRQLLEVGIETQYVSDDLIRNHNRHPFMFFYPDNAHPADACQDILTDCILERLERFDDILIPRLSDSEFAVVQGPTVYGSKYIWPKNCDIGDYRPGEEILCRHILKNSKPIVFDQNSPILVIGNSFIQTPMPADSYSSYLAQKLHLLPDNFRVSGYGPMLTIVNSLFNNRERYLSGKKVVILPLGVNLLTSLTPFVNIAELDRMKQQLNGRTLRETMNPEINRFKPERSNDTGPLFLRWQEFVQQSVAELVLPHGEDYKIPPMRLSDKVDTSKESVCYIQIAAFHLQSFQLSVNGISQTVPPYTTVPQWQNMVFVLPAETDRLDVSLRSSLPETVVAIKNIMIYQ